MILAVLYGSVAACSTSSPDDPQGVYHLMISMRPEQLQPEPLPTTVSWPHTTDLTLRFDADAARVEVFGLPATVATQEVVESGSLRFTEPVPGGTLFLGVNSAFMVSVDDLAACPQHGPLRIGAYVELFFLDGHVHGATSDAITCYLPPPDAPSQGFIFDITGDRIAD